MAVESTRSVAESLGSPRAEARVGPADANAYELAAGEYVQIEDIQGCQVSDFLAFHRSRPGIGISTTVTRALVDGLFPLPGQCFYDGDGNALLELVDWLVTEIRPVAQAELGQADEIWIGSAGRGVLPVTSLDGRPVGKGRPGPHWRRARETWQRHLDAIAATPPL